MIQIENTMAVLGDDQRSPTNVVKPNLQFELSTTTMAALLTVRFFGECNRCCRCGRLGIRRSIGSFTWQRGIA
ncbi:hypothetical protein K239x_24560 [Planctomycetes bacterium K23_9]|uniref:Uncharacterized protein n=1 Tax=Stieleria marina TaxID=1930275 RepID=A0A517NTQ5_9BACT|nr:hypothetical protein K239x_24560 [Planctomycetes bacterium K23_9]